VGFTKPPGWAKNKEKQDEQRKVIDRLRVINSLVEEKGREKNTDGVH
jgi:hypothetical protein